MSPSVVLKRLRAVTECLLNVLALLGVAPAGVLQQAVCEKKKNPWLLLKEVPGVNGRKPESIDQCFVAVIAAVSALTREPEVRRVVENDLCELKHSYTSAGLAANWMHVATKPVVARVLERAPKR